MAAARSLVWLWLSGSEGSMFKHPNLLTCTFAIPAPGTKGTDP